MENRRDRRGRDNARTNRVMVIGISGLTLLVVTVLAFAMLRTNSAPEPAAVVATASAPAAAPVAVATTPQPAPMPVAAPPAPAPKVAQPVATSQTSPEKLASVPAGSRQIIVITGSAIGSNTGTLEVYNMDGGVWTQVMGTSANFGQAGLVDGVKRTSGHLQTPTGVWSIGSFLFGQHPSAPAGTKMPYRAITQNSWWSGEHNSSYNEWVESKSSVNGEHLADAKVQYEYAFNTGYNSLPNERVVGRGTAIFIHCFEPPNNSLGQFTHGCIAISRDKIVELFGILDPARNPTCAIGTLQKGSPTSIWAY